MARLTSKSPCAGLLPREIGGFRLFEVDPGPITAILPYGESDDLLAPHGLDWPAPGMIHHAGDMRAVWAGLDTVLLIGGAPDPTIADRAALVDHSDAWAWIAIEGDALSDLAARLTPLDLGNLPPGRAARSLVGHMTGLLIRPAESRLEIAVFRSMAGTLVHDVRRAVGIVSTRISHGV